MSGYQRIKVTRPGDGPLWIIEHPACEHEEIWRHWSDAISAAHAHAQRCPALRLQRLLADLEADAERAEQRADDAEQKAERFAHKASEICWAAVAHENRNRARDMRALVARHRGEGDA